MEAILSSETLFFTTVTRRHVLEDGILQTGNCLEGSCDLIDLAETENQHKPACSHAFYMRILQPSIFT
jgi:hypothetical protein